MATETLIQVHLEPKTKYFAQRFARNCGMSLGTYIEHCVSTVLSVTETPAAGSVYSFEDVELLLWHENAADRFVLTATHFPKMLTDRERILWIGVIRHSPEFWNVPITFMAPVATVDSFRFDVLRARWKEYEAMDRNALLVLSTSIREQFEALKEGELSAGARELRDSLRTQMTAKKAKADAQFEQEMVEVRKKNAASAKKGKR